MSNFTFTPVTVTRGRKFRGRAYSLGDVRPGMWGTWNSKLWEPTEKKYVWANVDFLEEDTSATPEQVQLDKDRYVMHVIDDTIQWCRSKKPDAPTPEVMQFARNMLHKYHPEIDEATLALQGLTDQRDLATEVEKTVSWAKGLVTRPCYMYGRFCRGGRPISDEKKVHIAYQALHKKGFTSKPEFEAAWAAALEKAGLKA